MRTVSIGKQRFDSAREENYFYIDKTSFIKEWWESGDEVTLITRPRRFGKTFNMSMLECFFSTKYENRGDLFEGLSIWEEEKYRELQGTYPVIFLSFADVKQQNYEDAITKIKKIFSEVYTKHRHLWEAEWLTEEEKKKIKGITERMSDIDAQDCIKELCSYLSRYYNKNVIVILDEYDTPMQEAYLGGYWKEFTGFIRGMFNATFKTNPYLERAIMTGITRVSKESIFSDLNHLNVVTTTTEQYATAFGFTEEEVYAALCEAGMTEEMPKVKEWYDGFTFGNVTDIYNPWSITNFLKKKKYTSYWADTSSNGLINTLIQKGNKEIKMDMECLLKGESIQVSFDEQIIFQQLEENEDAIWSLMVASGYLKVEQVAYEDEEGEEYDTPLYQLRITNKEVRQMFSRMFTSWFRRGDGSYNDFVKALLKGDLEEMNYYMNELSMSTFSFFDTGVGPSKKSQPERFYHGFVLGLLADLRTRYEICSNRESGLGRYDVMLIPKKEKEPGIVMEFKVHQPNKENSLEETVQVALKQIEEKKYDEVLFQRGIEKENIRHYGFAFEGKTVLIGE